MKWLQVLLFSTNNSIQHYSIVCVNFAGSEIFQAKVIERLRHLFKIKSEKVSEFQYIRLSIKESKDNEKLAKATVGELTLSSMSEQKITEDYAWTFF